MAQRTLLVTGFEPFGGETVNPSWEAVKALPQNIGPWRLHKLCLPVVYGKAGALAWEAARRLSADGILCVGQAGGRDAVTPETLAINLRYSALADNDGVRLEDVPVVPGGPAAYFSTAPVAAMVEAIHAAGVPARRSLSAGGYVCNDLLYTLLHRFRDGQIPIGFLHIPYLPSQAGENRPSLPLEQAVAALTAAIGVWNGPF